MTEPRALFVAPTTPARTGNGLAMRLGLFHDALARVAEVETLVLPVSGPSPDARFTEAFGKTASSITVAGRADTRFALLSRLADPAERLRQFRLYGRGSRHAALSAPVLADLARMLEGRRFDLLHVARLYLAEVRPVVPATRSSLDLDEDDAWAWRHAEPGSTPETDWSIAEAEAEDRLLARCAGGFDALFVSGEADRKTLLSRHPGFRFGLVANAVAFPPAPARRDDGRTLLFVGAFGYRPNVEGVLWFVHEVWPKLAAASSIPLRLRLVGRDPPLAIQGLHDPGKGIELVGFLDEVSSAYAEATLAIAPLHTGAGTRLKLIEAAAHGVPVVTTTHAARGLGFVDSATAWIADTPDAFAGAVLAALGDPAERQHRAELSLVRAKPLHDREQVIAELARRFTAMLQRQPVARESS